MGLWELLHERQRQRQRQCQRQLQLLTNSRSRASTSHSLPDESHGSNCISTHISSLPDDIFLIILSKLDTKSAVAISTQLRRWINLPLALPNLVLDDSLKRSDRSFWEYRLDFGTFGLRHIFLRSHVDKFRLRCHFQFQDSGIQAMIRAAVWKQVKEIDIWVGKNTFGRLPWEVLTSTTIVVLKIRGRIVFDVPEFVSLVNLKVFHSKKAPLPDNDSMRRFFESCKSLEELLLFGRLGHRKVIDITMQDLKRFSFQSDDDDMFQSDDDDDDDDMPGTRISIDAPKLEFFKYQGKLCKFSLVKKLKFLARAEILISGDVGDREEFWNFINSFNRVNSLYLSQEAILAAYPTPLNSLLEYVTILEVRVLDSLILPGILEIASQVKELVIHSYAYLSPRESKPVGDEAPLRWPDNVPLCLEECLKRIEFCVFSDKSQDILLIEYFLIHGKTLEVMVFSNLRREAPYIPAFKEKIEGFSKCSGCKLMYKNL